MLQKRSPYKSRKLLDRIAELPCVRCGAMDGTCVPAHYCGDYQHLLGKGIGSKVTDAAVAALCYKCHTEMDQYKGGNTCERSEEFLYLCIITHEALLKAGYLEVK
jgi:hypothetical protein